MQPVDPALPEKGEPGDGEGDGVGNAGFTPAVAAGDDGGIAKGEMGGLPVTLKPGQGHACDLKTADFFQRNILLHFFTMQGAPVMAKLSERR